MRTWHMLKHLTAPGWLLRRHFAKADLDALATAIAAAEQGHAGEICVVIEATLPWAALRRGLDSRARAAEMFAFYGVDRTRDASGVLLYVQLLDRRLEILADHGIAERVTQAEWDAISAACTAEFASGRPCAGLTAAISQIGALLVRHFPNAGDNPDELTNRPRLR